MSNPIAVGSLTEIRYAPEVVFGQPSFLPFKHLRNVSFGVNLQKEVYQSEERSPDRQRQDVRHGYHIVTGQIGAEVDFAALGEFIEAALGGVWVGPSSTKSFPALTLDSATSRVTVVSSAFDTLDIVKGDIFQISASAPIAGVTDRLFTAASVATQSIQVEAGDISTTTTVSATITKVSQRFTSGNIYRSFTVERYLSDLGLYQQFVGVRLNSVTFTAPASGLVNVNMDFIGRDAYMVSDSTYSIARQPLPQARRMVSVDAEIRIDGQTIGYATALELTINNNLAGVQVVGQDLVRNILFGQKQDVTGTMTLLLVNNEAYEKFINEETVEMILRLKDANTLTPSVSIMQFTLPRVKYMSAEVDDAPDTGIALQIAFTALAPEGSVSAAPLNLVPPVISGIPSIGAVLTCSTGIWLGSSYTYQWQRDSGVGFVDIGGATNSTFTVTSSDATFDLRCVVTATNLGGSTSAASNAVSIPEAITLVAPNFISSLATFTRAQVNTFATAEVPA
jgi:hypothetical protein